MTQKKRFISASRGCGKTSQQIRWFEITFARLLYEGGWYKVTKICELFGWKKNNTNFNLIRSPSNPAENS